MALHEPSNHAISGYPQPGRRMPGSSSRRIGGEPVTGRGTWHRWLRCQSTPADDRLRCWIVAVES